MELDTAQKAEIATAKVQIRAAEKAITLSLPTSDSTRYDAVIDDGNRLYRVQIKYCDRRSTSTDGALSCDLVTYHRSGKLSYAGYTALEIDAIIVYLPRIDKLLWFGPEIFAGKQAIQIRLEPTKNRQSKGCLFASDYIW